VLEVGLTLFALGVVCCPDGLVSVGEKTVREALGLRECLLVGRGIERDTNDFRIGCGEV